MKINIYITEHQRKNFKPTYLYVKEHKITKLKYFGKTTKNPIKYNGSGVRWNRHINKYGKEHINTIWYHLFDNIDLLVEFALFFSEEYNIENSNNWANLIYENGLDGGDTSKGRNPISEETRIKMRNNKLGKKQSEETKIKRSLTLTGVSHSIDRIKKNSESHKGIKLTPRSTETKLKISLALKSKPKYICIYCNRYFDIGNYNKNHGNKCKEKDLGL